MLRVWLERRPWVREAVLCVSLANIFFLHAWAELLYDTDIYFRKWVLVRSAYLAVVCDTLLLAGVCWLVWRWRRDGKRGWARPVAKWGACVLLLFPLNFIRYRLNWRYSELMEMGQEPLVWAAGMALGIGAWRWRGMLFKAGGLMLLVLAPFAVLNLGRSLWNYVSWIPPVVWSPVEVAGVAARAERRVVWVIFDELDYRLTFPERPAGLILPELDRLRAGGLFTLEARSPASNTREAMPSLISGKRVVEAWPAGESELMLELEDAAGAVGWSQLSSVFADARGLGLRTGLVGWYHPYSRILGKHLDACFWYPYPPSDPCCWTNFIRSLETPLRTSMPWNMRRLHLETYLATAAHARELASDPSLGMVLCHLPVPHFPGIYDGVRAEFSLTELPT